MANILASTLCLLDFKSRTPTVLHFIFLVFILIIPARIYFSAERLAGKCFEGCKTVIDTDTYLPCIQGCIGFIKRLILHKCV